jgi:hypothetical protein
MEQGTLDDYRAALAKNAGDTGMTAGKAADPIWVADVLEWIYNLPAGNVFDADLIRSVHGKSSAAGSVVNTARKRGWIVSVGVSRSKSLTRHHGLQLEWCRK